MCVHAYMCMNDVFLCACLLKGFLETLVELFQRPGMNQR